MKFSSTNVENLASTRIVGYDRLIQPTNHLACDIFHLRAMAAVMEHDNVSGLGFSDEVRLNGIDNACVSCLRVFQYQDILGRKLKLSHQNLPHRFHVVQ